MNLGTYGIYTFDFEFQSAAQLRDSARQLEDMGWRALWVPELLGRDAFTHAGLLLASTRQLNVVNGIARIWSREARWTKGASTLLADAYPGRHVLGLGFGGDPRPGVKPLAAMSAYLDELDTLETPNPGPETPVRRLLAAYGPKMLELARDRADGAQTYHVNTAHTAEAREILGPDAFLAVEHAVLFESDPVKARAVAREHLHGYLQTPYNLAKFRRLGYTEDDLSGGGSDRFVDDLVFWGDADTVVRKLRGHVDAGADHVAVQVVGVEPGASTLPYWKLLADALLPERAAASR
ncbi:MULTISPECIES: TIGR03620 family F420-dependent LLM class oxidoreductase [Streptomyces]|uniref:TIGR03620 family F420-dependent LLM class oxidoreductase n=1 Tax=Streptomyces TaxID=1883 RepID=UPI00166FA30A|nr:MULTISPECIES: TIGR03620 family F420-dependent LLM class oxidoreductase [Streptomyces]UFR06412.1 TIGR03620 family F420-dependent LLM class oxidoreductase [Streptomyces sp. Go40/10]GGS60924.1 LLM class F420-dependent oxidoreductase [Streptomyces cinerochromogenes]